MARRVLWIAAGLICGRASVPRLHQLRRWPGGLERHRLFQRSLLQQTQDRRSLDPRIRVMPGLPARLSSIQRQPRLPPPQLQMTRRRSPELLEAGPQPAELPPPTPSAPTLRMECASPAPVNTCSTARATLLTGSTPIPDSAASSTRPTNSGSYPGSIATAALRNNFLALRYSDPPARPPATRKASSMSFSTRLWRASGLW